MQIKELEKEGKETEWMEKHMGTKWKKTNNILFDSQYSIKLEMMKIKYFILKY